MRKPQSKYTQECNNETYSVGLVK